MKTSRAVAAGMSAAVVFGGGMATAAVRAPTSVKACVGSSGNLSLLVKGRCAKGAHLVRLSASGPRGLTGAAGTAGPAGPTGAPGAPGQPGAAGPSNVYAWSGVITTPGFSGTVDVPAGSYVVSWRGSVSNNSGSTVTTNCYLDVNLTGRSDGLVTVPTGEYRPIGYEQLIRAASPFTVNVDCPTLGGTSVDSVVITATATGSLTGTGVTLLP